jgi:hypothetical protein
VVGKVEVGPIFLAQPQLPFARFFLHGRGCPLHDFSRTAAAALCTIFFAQPARTSPIFVFGADCGGFTNHGLPLAVLRQGVRDKLAERGLKVINMKLVREVCPREWHVCRSFSEGRGHCYAFRQEQADNFCLVLNCLPSLV